MLGTTSSAVPLRVITATTYPKLTTLIFSLLILSPNCATLSRNVLPASIKSARSAMCMYVLVNYSTVKKSAITVTESPSYKVKLNSQLGMLNFLSKFKFWPLKFGLNSNFVYTFVEKLKQFAFDVCTVEWDEGHSTHATRREAVYQQCNQPERQAMYRSIAINWCLLCVWAIKICHFDRLHQ